MRGHARGLVEAILTATFRAERHGRRILDEPLPEELPIAGSDDAKAAWTELVELQAGYRKRGFSDPWEFHRGIRKLNQLLSQPMHSWTRSMVKFDLETGCRDFPDDELERHWNEWARDEGPNRKPPNYEVREWDESTFANLWLVRGLPAEEARSIVFAESASNQF